LKSKIVGYFKFVLVYAIACKLEFVLEKLLTRAFYYGTIPAITATFGGIYACIIISLILLSVSLVFIKLYDHYDWESAKLFSVKHYVTDAKGFANKVLRKKDVSCATSKMVNSITFLILAWQVFPAVCVIFSRKNKRSLTTIDTLKLIFVSVASSAYFIGCGMVVNELSPVKRVLFYTGLTIYTFWNMIYSYRCAIRDKQ
jgi:uncharacterized membrane protein